MPTTRTLSAGVLAAAAFATSGCAAFRASTQDIAPSQTVRFGAAYDYSDMRVLTEEVVGTMSNHPVFARAPETEAPIVVIAGVDNRTTQYVDTKNITDRIRTLMINNGSARFINESRRAELLKEQGYQAEHATPETQAAIGRQLGAKYMITGSLVEMKQTSPRQVRVSKQELRYYKFTLEVTDLETGLISATTEKEFARQASKPLIGW